MVGGEAGEAEAVVKLWSVPLSVAELLLRRQDLPVAVAAQLAGRLGFSCLDVGVGGRSGPPLVGVVDKVTAGAVRAETDGVEGATGLRFVLGVAGQAPQLVVAVSKLTLLPVLAGPVLLEGPAKLGLVARGVDLRAGLLLQHGPLPALAVRAVTELVLLVHDGRGAAVAGRRVLLQAAVGAHRVFVAVVERIHVAGGVSAEKSRREGATGARSGDRSPHRFLVKHAVDVEGVHVHAFILLQEEEEEKKALTTQSILGLF